MNSKRLPAPALVVSCIALLVAMSGVSYAAVKMPRNSVGMKHLKRGAVNSAKVRNGSLTMADMAPSARTQVYVASMPASPTAITDVNGNPGDVHTALQTLTLPKGVYVISAETFVNDTSALMAATARCRIAGTSAITGSGAERIQSLEGSTLGVSEAWLSMQAVATLAGPGSVRVECTKGGMAEGLEGMSSIYALKVAKATVN